MGTYFSTLSVADGELSCMFLDGKEPPVLGVVGSEAQWSSPYFLALIEPYTTTRIQAVNLYKLYLLV
jgi:hypothetical protein